LPTIWFRNRWSWTPGVHKPRLCVSGAHANVIALNESYYGQRWLICDHEDVGGTRTGAPELLFTENETNERRLFGSDTSTRYAKDGINDRVVSGVRDAVNPAREGTKASAWYTREIAGGESVTWRLRFTNVEPITAGNGPHQHLASLGDDF